MLDQQRAAEIVDRIDLRALPICPLCHLELAFAIVDELPRRVLAGIATRACAWVLPEIETELRAQLRRAAMRGDAWADEALADLDARRFRSRIVREIVLRVATGIADEMREEVPKARPHVLTFPRSPPA